MTRAEQAALDKWAETCERRAEIEDFIHWIHTQGVFFKFGKTGHTIARLLDSFYGIKTSSACRCQTSRGQGRRSLTPGGICPIAKEACLDDILACLRIARTAVVEDPAKSRELSLVLTKIDEAIQWRQSDLQIKKSSTNQHSNRPD